MSNSLNPVIVLGLLLGTAVTASASDQPPNSVNSDSQGNTAMGTEAMGVTTSGTDNTAAGYFALDSDYQGSFNTALGASALTANGTGNNNTALGYEALLENTSGSSNTATGFQALLNNTTGTQNTAAGYQALHASTTASDNTAFGSYALAADTSGVSNDAAGVGALQSNTTGSYNVAQGLGALKSNKTGSSNIAQGYFAGENITGSNNIDIGNRGTSTDSATIRIGVQNTQTKTFIAGIYGTSVSGSAVTISSTGQLGVTVSSERFKTAIKPMDSHVDLLQQLRPVTFHLKTDPQGTLQYGLIAEEVAKVYPDLVVRNETGRIDGVRYDELAPILVRELQQERMERQRDNEITRTQIAALMKQNEAMQAALVELRRDGAKLAAR